MDRGKMRFDEIRIEHGDEIPGQFGMSNQVDGCIDRREIKGWRDALETLGGHPETRVEDFFVLPQWAVTRNEIYRRLDRWICRDILWTGLSQDEMGQEAENLAAHIAEHAKRLRLALEPVRRDLRRGLPLMARDHRQDSWMVVGRRHFGVGAAQRRPFIVGAVDGAMPTQVEQIEPDALLLHATRLCESGVEGRKQAMGETAEALGIAPAPVGVQRLARQIVGKEAKGAVFDKGELAQPLEERMRIASAVRLRAYRLAMSRWSPTCARRYPAPDDESALGTSCTRRSSSTRTTSGSGS